MRHANRADLRSDANAGNNPNRQDTVVAKILVRLERENRTMAKHERTQNLPSILVLEDPRVCPPGSLGSLLRRMDPVIPKGADGLGQHPGLEQRVCNDYFDIGRDCHGHGTGGSRESTSCSGSHGSKDEMIERLSCYGWMESGETYKSNIDGSFFEKQGNYSSFLSLIVFS